MLFLDERWGIIFALRVMFYFSTYLSIPSWFLVPTIGKTNHINKIKTVNVAETKNTE